MKLYSSPISPYAARCRIQIAHQRLPVAIIPPPDGMRSEAVLAKNPAGRIPVLDLGERAISESWAIMNYLDSTQAGPAMLPADAYLRAKLEERVRFVDIYLAPAMFPLFRALRGGASENETQAAITGLQEQLATLDALLADPSVPASDGLTLADAALLPVIWYARILARHFGTPDCLADTPVVRAWWQQARSEPAAAQVLDEMETALRAAIPPLLANA